MNITNEIISPERLSENKLELVRDEEAFFKEIADIRLEYEAAIKEISTKLEILDDDFKQHDDHGPIHHIQYRLKSVNSMFDKAVRYGIEDPLNNLEEIRSRIYDIAGVRVVCNYRDDIYVLSNLLLKQEDIKLIRIKDYSSNPKESGYRSLHVVISVPVFLVNEKVSIPVEIQFRSIAMDTWASLEHELKYKNEGELSENVQTKLKVCAEILAYVDNRMENIRHEVFFTE